MCTHHKDISLWSSCTHKIFWFTCPEYFFILKSLPEHVFQHFIKIHANLSGAFHVLIFFTLFSFLALYHHLTFVTFCNCSYLKSHIGFIDCDNIMHEVSKLFCHICAVSCKILYGCLTFPSTFLYQPYRRCKMHHGDNRLYSIVSAAFEHLFVMLCLCLVKFSFFRLYTRPLYGKTIRVKTCLRHQADILLIAVIVVNCIQ